MLFGSLSKQLQALWARHLQQVSQAPAEHGGEEVFYGARLSEESNSGESAARDAALIRAMQDGNGALPGGLRVPASPGAWVAGDAAAAGLAHSKATRFRRCVHLLVTLTV